MLTCNIFIIIIFKRINRKILQKHFWFLVQKIWIDLQCVHEYPGHPVKMQILIEDSWVYYLIACISNKLPSIANAAGLAYTLRSKGLERNTSHRKHCLLVT